MIAQTHKDFTRERLSPHFVYESYDPKTRLYFNRGSVGFVLKGWPLVGATLQVESEVSEFLKEEENLPAGASFQVLMVGTQNIDKYLNYWVLKRKGEMFQHLAKRRAAFLQKSAREEGVIKDVFLLVSLTIPTLNPKESLIADMEKRRDTLKATFKSIGLLAEDMEGEDLLRTLRDFFGWPLGEHPLEGHPLEGQPPYNPYESLSEQIVPPDFKVEAGEERLSIQRDDKEPQNIVALEAMKMPHEWRLDLMDLFLGNERRRGEQIKADFFISFGLQVLPRQGYEKSKVLTKRETLLKNLKSGLLKWMPGLEEEYEDINSGLKALQAGERVVKCFQHVILKDSPDKIKERVFEFRSQLRRVGFHFVPARGDHLPVLLSTLPMQLVEEKKGLFTTKTLGYGPEISALGRGLKTVSGVAKALLPIVGEWKGDLRSPGMILSGRRGQIMYWSPFGPVLVPEEGKTPTSNENFNLCIAGVPGSGKSVFMQELMLSTLGVGGRVFVLDYGRSFKRTCQILKGTYIEFDLKNPVSLNPFSKISEREEDFEAREDALSGIAAVLSTMAAPQEGTNDLQNAILQKALRAVWAAHGNLSEISDIAGWLLKRDENYAQDLGNMLFPFTADGIYGKFFKGPAGLSLNSKIVVIETDHLRNVPALLSVVVQMMIVHINQTMVRGERKYPFLIMIDEAWKLLQGKASGAFIEEMGRIARKYKGSITLATQQLTDYFRAESPAAEKAFENASWKAILKQNPESLLAMQSNPKLASFVKEPWQLELLQSVHSNPPHYSEAALFGPDVKGVIGRLKLDPFTLLLTSTNAEDYQALEDLCAQGLGVVEAIETVLQKRGLS